MTTEGRHESRRPNMNVANGQHEQARKGEQQHGELVPREGQQDLVADVERAPSPWGRWSGWPSGSCWWDLWRAPPWQAAPMRKRRTSEQRDSAQTTRGAWRHARDQPLSRRSWMPYGIVLSDDSAPPARMTAGVYPPPDAISSMPFSHTKTNPLHTRKMGRPGTGAEGGPIARYGMGGRYAR